MSNMKARPQRPRRFQHDGKAGPTICAYVGDPFSRPISPASRAGNMRLCGTDPAACDPAACAWQIPNDGSSLRFRIETTEAQRHRED